MRDYHPYNPFFPRYAKKLILGSIPPHRFCKNEKGKTYGKLYQNDVDFYYGSYKNHFWKIIQEIFKIKFDFTLSDKAIEQRKRFLEENKIAIFDVIQSCKRINNKSSDKDLYEIEWMNLNLILKQNPSIQTILCTSQFVRKSLFQIIKPIQIEKQNQLWNLQTEMKTLKVIQLYSPSPLLVRALGKEGIQKRFEQYQKFLLK